VSSGNSALQLLTVTPKPLPSSRSAVTSNGQRQTSQSVTNRCDATLVSGTSSMPDRRRGNLHSPSLPWEETAVSASGRQAGPAASPTA